MRKIIPKSHGLVAERMGILEVCQILNLQYFLQPHI